MKRWSWWLAWQVLRGRIRSIQLDRIIHEPDEIVVRLDSDGSSQLVGARWRP